MIGKTSQHMGVLVFGAWVGVTQWAQAQSQSSSETLSVAASAINAVPAHAAPAASDSSSVTPAVEKSAQVLFEQTCGACHTLALPSRQRLDRANWEWVMNDMVTLYGCNWTTELERAKILDYLVENFGRDKPR